MFALVRRRQRRTDDDGDAGAGAHLLFSADGAQLDRARRCATRGLNIFSGFCTRSRAPGHSVATPPKKWSPNPDLSLSLCYSLCFANALARSLSYGATMVVCVFGALCVWDLQPWGRVALPTSTAASSPSSAACVRRPILPRRRRTREEFARARVQRHRGVRESANERNERTRESDTGRKGVVLWGDEVSPLRVTSYQPLPVASLRQMQLLIP